MAAPAKPWEGLPGVHNRIPDLSSSPSFMPSPLPERPPMTTSSITNLSNPPPLPPKPQASGLGMTSSFGMPYGGYSSGLGSYGGFGGMGGLGMGGYSSYGGYGGMGGLGGGGYGMYGSPYGYNRFGGGGMYGDAESRFIQIAEESSRPTFQSIESIVGAVGSVAMMLENTFMAMTSSFRAILGVAENFGRLRSLFAQFWSAFAIFRSINWLLKKLLVLMGIRTEDEFKAWARATAAQQRESQGEIPEGGRRASSWPALVFLGVIMTVPYLIMKLLGSLTSSIQANVMDPSTWKNPMKAIAQFDFQATSPREISFRSQQMITIAPEALQGSFWNSGWLMATVDNKNVGLIPTNYVKVFRNQVPAAPVSLNMMIKDKPNVDVSSQQLNDSCPAASVPEISIEKLNESLINNTAPVHLPSNSDACDQPTVNFDECFEKAKETP